MQDLGTGPLSAVFYDVIVFNQPCYDRGRARIYSAALTRELSAFANVRYRGNLLFLTSAFFDNNEICLTFLLNSRAQGVSGKNEQSTQTPLRGAQCSCIGLRPALLGTSPWIEIFESAKIASVFHV